MGTQVKNQYQIVKLKVKLKLQIKVKVNRKNPKVLNQVKVPALLKVLKSKVHLVRPARHPSHRISLLAKPKT